MNHILIVGGSDAGISAALRAKEIDPEVNLAVLVKDRYPNFSICGLPFYLSGEVKDWRYLAHRTVEDIERAGIHLLLEHTAESINPVEKEISVINRQGGFQEIGYDKLVIGTGAVSIRPAIEGIDLPGVFFLRWMDDAFALYEYLQAKNPRSAIIVGAGYIGMEMADALNYRGIKVTVVEYADSVLTTVDRELGFIVRKELEAHGVAVETGVGISGIHRVEKQLVVKGSKGFSLASDMVLVAVGAHPQTELARLTGIETGIKGAIKVDRHMKTNISDIFAAGDCVETWHRLTQKNTYMPLGTTAHKQGRVAGENAAGGNCEFQGSLGTQSVKIFDLVVARTGLRDSEAVEAGFSPFTVEFETWDHKVYYPEAEKMCIRITGDRNSRRLIGAQIAGHFRSEVSKRIDIIASAIYNNMHVNDLNDLDLSYTPPLSSPWDPVQMAAQEWNRKVE